MIYNKLLFSLGMFLSGVTITYPFMAPIWWKNLVAFYLYYDLVGATVERMTGMTLGFIFIILIFGTVACFVYSVK